MKQMVRFLSRPENRYFVTLSKTGGKKQKLEKMAKGEN